MKVLEREMRLHDAGGLHSGPQHVLLRGDVLGLGYPLQVVQVAGGGWGAEALERCRLLPSHQNNLCLLEQRSKQRMFTQS